MELNGALCNLDLAGFRRLDGLRARLAAAAPAVPVPWPEPRRRPGWVLAAVTEVLGWAVGQPMQAREIHVAVEGLLGEPVSWSSIKNCLASNVNGEGPRFEREGYGRYRLAAQER